MNERLQFRTVPATVALVGVNAALAIGQATWPVQEPAYVTIQEVPSFSFFESSLNSVESIFAQDFANEIASVYAGLSEGQEPLGPEFEAVWDANVERLYES